MLSRAARTRPTPQRALLAWIRSRIPDASPEAAALFQDRFWRRGADIRAAAAGGRWLGDRADQRALRPHQLMVSLFHGRAIDRSVDFPLGGLWGSLFIVGAFTRMAFALTSLGVFAWAILYTTRITYHTVCALLVALLCLLWSRWGDAWSIDALQTSRRCPAPRRRSTASRYGCRVWCLGLIFAAAAFAKLRESGIAWILNGTVKYHFLTDSRQAMVDWGLRLGQLSLGCRAAIVRRHCHRKPRHRRRAVAVVPLSTALPAYQRWLFSRDFRCCRGCSGRHGGFCCSRSCRGIW